MKEHELSVVFSVPSSMYTRLFLTLSSASSSLYTDCKMCIKNIFHLDGEEGDEETKKTHIRTVQDDLSFTMQRKKIINEQHHRCLYRHQTSYLTLFMPIRERESIEEQIDLNDYMDRLKSYKQVVRDYIYCRTNGIRIAVERHFDDYIDDDIYQMDYDCFNRYKYECYIHIELENHTNVSNFIREMTRDEIIYRLLAIMASKNLNCISDEIINIQNMTLTHKYGYANPRKRKNMNYYSLKYDGIRYNFCIFGKFVQIGRHCIQFNRHWFGQVIVGHCEILESGEVIIIDIYLIAENFNKIAKKYNISYTGALQNYHHFYTNIRNETSGPKTQDEYFHMKRLMNNIKFVSPIDAIEIIGILQEHVWPYEELHHDILLQTFYPSFQKLCVGVQNCKLKIDGFLGYTPSKIYKLKRDLTIDLVLKFDEMFRNVYKKMKASNQDLKKMIEYANIQKTLNWYEFERKYPGRFNKFAVEFLYFSQDKNFYKHYSDWKVYIDIDLFHRELSQSNGTYFILLLEFEVKYKEKTLVFTRLRDDKFSANSINVFSNILKQF
ncbi:late expression factor 4 (LEF 4) [Drosophila suzukii associated hytrosavirus 1]|nr:late expression factor 4 (LEF 4) [Drosophila suzukii associated hytrosavirus 1]